MGAVNQGEVAITVDGEEMILRSSLLAAKTINANFGSFGEAYQRIAKMDLAAYVAIVAAGVGAKGTPKGLDDQIYQTGMPSLVEPLTEYLNLLANGGRSPAPAKDADTGN
jgi:hypothetical protein